LPIGRGIFSGIDEMTEFEATTFRLASGKFSFSLTHIASGLRAEDDRDEEDCESILYRWSVLRDRLAKLLESRNVKL
jgi:hypothetical protein